MGPWLKSHYLLFLGEGLERFNRFDAARAAFEETIEFAAANQIHAVTFKAESALVALRGTRRVPTAAPVSFELPQGVLAAAHAISELRKAALVEA
ncbi:MAG TPA: hypothetical protein VFS56_06530, partial [Gemmatimonadaceae bacterium]|nr:hypothetical protein [Gemmatimonadaceae bacterium]